MKIKLGKNTLGGIENYNYKAYQSRAVLINGINGARKSSLLVEIATQFMTGELEVDEQRPIVVVIDVEDEFGRLREVNPSIVIVGDNGEISLDIKYAKELGRQVRLQNIDVILQLASLETDAEIELFVAQFISGLMIQEGKFSDVCRPVVLIGDEAQDLCGNGGKIQKSRDAIKRVAQKGRKFGIVPFFAVQDINELYIRARNQFENSIMGYHKDLTQRKISAIKIGLPESKADVFLELRNEPLGRFWCEGADISKSAVMFQLESKKYEHKRTEIPKISEHGLRKAEQLRLSLNNIPVSTETILQNKMKQMESEIMKLQMNQMTPANILLYKKEGELKGWQDCVADHRNMIYQIKKKAEKRSLFSKPFDIVINSVISDGKEHLVIDSGGD